MKSTKNSIMRHRQRHDVDVLLWIYDPHIEIEKSSHENHLILTSSYLFHDYNKHCHSFTL